MTTNYIKVSSYETTFELVGEAIGVYLRDGGKFNFKVTGASDTAIRGYDEEMLNLSVDVEDIDYIVRRGDK